MFATNAIKCSRKFIECVDNGAVQILQLLAFLMCKQPLFITAEEKEAHVKWKIQI